MDDPNRIEFLLRHPAGTTWPLLLAFLAGYVGSVDGQSSGARSSVTVFAGKATGGPGSDGLMFGLELRTPELGRLSAAAAGSTWQLANVSSCDVVPGQPCDDDRSVKAFDVGPVVRLTPLGRSWRLEATARIGALWDRSGDRLWTPSMGAGFGFGQSRRVGGLLAFRYSRPSSLTNRPDTEDHFTASAGLQLRF
jgi:hypothetical protein